MEEISISTLENTNIYPNELYTDYQPLYRLENKILFGFESLLRSKNGISPDRLFDQARLESQVNTLDRLAIQKGMTTYSEYNTLNTEYLFVNILPSTLLQDDFSHFLNYLLQEVSFTQNHLVFELSETVSEAKYWNTSELQKVISSVRKKGIQIAIDDVGSGVACNQKIIEFEPEFVKLDKYFGRDLSKSKLKQKMVESYSRFCEDNATLVLEGIETKEDLEVAKQLGVTMGQGYFLGRPGRLGVKG